MRNQSITNKPRHGHVRRNVLIAVGAIIAIVVLAIVIDSALYYNKVHAGIRVSTVSLGGLTRDEAVAELSSYVAEAQGAAIELTDGSKTWSVMPDEAGVKIDVESAVSAAMEATRKSNFFGDLAKRIKLYFSGEEIALQGTVDEDLVGQLLAGIAEEIDVPPVNAGLTIEGTEIKVVEGQSGTVVDQDALHAQLEATLLSLHATQIEIPMMVKEPDVQAEDNQEALEQARTMISNSVKLTRGDKTWTLTSAQIASFMDFTSEDSGGISTLVPYLSAEKMISFFDEIVEEVATEPVDASFDSDGTKAWVVPGVQGEALDCRSPHNGGAEVKRADNRGGSNHHRARPDH